MHRRGEAHSGRSNDAALNISIASASLPPAEAKMLPSFRAERAKVLSTRKALRREACSQRCA